MVYDILVLSLIKNDNRSRLSNPNNEVKAQWFFERLPFNNFNRQKSTRHCLD